MIYCTTVIALTLKVVFFIESILLMAYDMLFGSNSATRRLIVIPHSRMNAPCFYAANKHA